MGPGRPPNERDIQLLTNGSPIFLGALVSTGALVNNVTTADPFNHLPVGPAGSPGSPLNLANTLAGKTLLLQPTAAGSILPSASNSVASPTLRLAQQTVLPPLVNTTPGPKLATDERVIVIMLPTEGWLQWLPVSGSANLLVWELR